MSVKRRRPRPVPASFYEVLTAAIADFSENGYDSQQRLDAWIERIRAAAIAALVPEAELERALQDLLGRVYRDLVEDGGLRKMNVKLSGYTLARIKPTLRAELDRRILASANLIRLNRAASIERTLQRFAGWATSIPIGGTEIAKRKKTNAHVRRGIAALPFEERRVIVDQGHKLSDALSDIVARDGGAIAGVWHSHWREAGYDYRPKHKARDRKVYLIRDSWAASDGFVRPAGAEYMDELTRPGEEVFCRCYYEYLYALSELPDAMLTAKGREALKETRDATHAAA